MQPPKLPTMHLPKKASQIPGFIDHLTTAVMIEVPEIQSRLLAERAVRAMFGALIQMTEDTHGKGKPE